MSKADRSSNQTIKLIMLNGPMSGQLFNFKPGRKVQIGRIVRGNAVTIKDACVSSKHLLIEYQLLQGHWIITDLNSSNGTSLNGRSLEPFKPAQVSNGDVIEISEAILISVKIEVNEEESMMVNRKPPRRSSRNLACKDKKVVVELEDTDEDLDLACKDKKVVIELEDTDEDLDGIVDGEEMGKSVEIEVNEEESMTGNGKLPRRRGRNSACKDIKVVIELEDTDEDLDGIVDVEEIEKSVEIEVNEEESMLVNRKPPRRKGRNSACNGIVDDEEMGKLVEIEVNEEESIMVNRKPPKRRGRNSACKDKKVDIELEEPDEDLDGIVEGEEMGKLVEIEVNEVESMMVNRKPPRHRGRNSACKDKKVDIELEETDEDLDGIVDGEEMGKSVEIEVDKEESMMVNRKPPGWNSACKDKKVDNELEETNEDLDGIVDGEEMGKSSTSQDAQALFHTPQSAYSATPTNLKVIDHYIVFAISTALMQLVYVAIVGSFPFNSFLSGVLSCVGTAVLAVCLRMQVNKENKEFKDLPPERAYADFVLSNLVLHLVIMAFLG